MEEGKVRRLISFENEVILRKTVQASICTNESRSLVSKEFFREG